MSELNAETLALSPAIAQQHREVVDALDDSPNAFHFARQRWQNGILTLIGSVLMMGTGGFLIYEIPATPALKLQMALLAGLLLIGSVIMLWKVLLDLFGSVCVDRHGIHMRPAIAGFSAPWSNVLRWEVCDEKSASYLPSLKVWIRGRPDPYAVPAGVLSHHDLHRLRKLLLVGHN